MANKTFNTRLKLKYDTYTNWHTKNPVLLAGELAICVVPADSNQATNEPTVLMKCGDGTSTFNELGWISGLSADVYEWAKSENKPKYSANEITGLSDYISGEIQDTNTVFKLESDAENGRKFYLYSKEINGEWGTTPVSTITIPEKVYTLVTGTANGTVKFNGEDVAVKGLGSAAYTDSTAYDANGAAKTAEDNAKAYADGKIGTVADGTTVIAMIADAKKAGTDAAAAAQAAQATADSKTTMEEVEAKGYATKTEAQDYANAKDAAIAAAQSTADTAQEGVNGLKTRVSTIEGDYLKTADKIALQTAIDTERGRMDAFLASAEFGDVAIDTLKELQDYITTHGGAAATLTTKVGTLETTVGKAAEGENPATGLVKSVADNASAIAAEQTRAKGIEGNLQSAINTLNGANTVNGSVAKTVKDAVDAAQATLQGNIDKKVDKVSGKGLSTNDYTNDEKTKLEGIAAGAQVNVIETVKVNGVALTPTAKAVDVTVPTGALASKNKVSETDLVDALATKINGKLDASAVTGNLLTHNASEFAAAGHNHDTVYSKLDHNHKIENLEQTAYIVFDCGTASTVI